MADNLVEELLRRAQQDFMRDAAVDGDHLTANLFFADAACFVFLVAGTRPLAGLAADNAALDLPVEEIGAGIAAPQGAIAIEDGDRRLERQHGFDELFGFFRRTQNCFSEEIISVRDRRS
jgi:hypothetical protein